MPQASNDLEKKIIHLIDTIPLKDGDTPLSSYLVTLKIIDNKALILFEIPQSILIDSAAIKETLENKIQQEISLKEISISFAHHKSTKKQPHSIQGPIELPTIKNIIAVASGKGGVGKSTTAVNLAIAFAKQNLSVGIMDADIYGPSLPRLMNITEKPTANEHRKLIPLVKHGIKCMSIGFMIDEETPVIWRGPMVMGTVQQLLKDVDWGNLDLLIIDMPPGTGDAHLTISQQVNLSGAIIVSTPQDIALIDARKGLNMFKKMGVPVLGVIENMSFFCCPACGTNTPIFSTNGAAQEAEKLEVPFLGKIPIELAIRESADEGLPVMLKDHHPHIQNIYGEMSRKIWKQLEA